MLDIFEIYSKYAFDKNNFISKCFSKDYVLVLISLQKIKNYEERKKIIDAINPKIIIKAPGIKFLIFKCSFFILGREKTLNLLFKRYRR